MSLGSLPGHDKGILPFRSFTIRLHILLAVIGVALFSTRLSGLPNFEDNEWRLSSYVLDLAENGAVFVQTDLDGDVASKPPMLTWMASIPVLVTGEMSPFAMYWPSALATIVTAVVLLWAGTNYFGWQAGFAAGVSYLLSYAAIRQMQMPRYDGLLALPVLLGAIAAFRAWQTGRGWKWFWFWTAIGTLVKGPIALLLSGAGLLAAAWPGIPRKPMSGAHRGLLIYLLLTAGWFALAYLELGPPVIEKMIQKELVGHAVSSGPGRSIGSFFEPAFNTFRLYLPWSIFALLACWRIVKEKETDPERRALERFLAIALLAGVIFFTLASHHRSRIVLPLIPFFALFAGKEIARLTTAWTPTRFIRTGSAAALAVILVVAIQSHWMLRRDLSAQMTAATEELAGRFETAGEKHIEVAYLGEYNPLQIWLESRENLLTPPQAIALLSSNAPAYVVVTGQILPIPANLARNVREVYRWPATGDKVEFRILSNQPGLPVGKQG